ncbi:MAG: hypothetical protein H6934_13595 [Burkholderiaceae bacterium]|nr:hypothetical protein [Burkholderiaceae bacterium]
MNDSDRVKFHAEIQVMEVDLNDAVFDSAARVDAFYDELTRQVEQTGRKWYFLIDYGNCRVWPEAWIAWANRGKRLNLGWSMGTVRAKASAEIRSQIEASAGRDTFDANLIDTHADALATLADMKAADERAELARHPKLDADTMAEFERRLRFDPDEHIMETDFSEYEFADSRSVDAFYDFLERRVNETGRKWYFLVNYRRCLVDQLAWIAFASRGKKLNLAWSLGSVRYDASPETAAEIRARAGTEAFDPNLFPSRDEAVGRIREMRQAA